MSEKKSEAGDLDALGRANTFQMMFRCARRVDERARALINTEAGRIVARPSTMALLPHIAPGGTRIVDLADKLGITKQAASQRVSELASEGLLELLPDPTDRRARLARFTPRGYEAIAHGLSVLAAIERDIAAQIGEDRMRQLLESLLEIDDTLSRLEESEP